MNQPDAHDDSRRGVSRRTLVRSAPALGIAATGTSLLPRSTAAQRATPVASPVAIDPVTSITRDEYATALRDAFAPEPPGATGGQLIYAQTSDIDTLNPTLVSDTFSAVIGTALFESLVVVSPIDGTDAPGLADRWEIGVDGLTYTFHLNPKATWHDGTPLTAADVVFTFESVLGPASLSPRQSAIAAILASVRAIDDHTMEFVALDRLATFVTDIGGQVGILPRHIWSEIPAADWGTAPGSTGTSPDAVVGSGPFRFVEWLRGDHVTVARHDGYWDTSRVPTIDEFIYRIVGEEAAVIQALRTGEIDVADIPFVQVGPLIESDRELLVTEFDTFDFTYVHFNLDEATDLPFRETDVRKAMMLALDRALIVDTVYQSLAIVAEGTQPALSTSYAPEEITSQYRYDPDAARALLDGAGFVDTDSDGIREWNGTPFSFEFQYAEGDTAYDQLIPYLQQAWGEIGVTMVPVRIPFPTLIDNIVNGTFAGAIAQLSWDTTGNQGPVFRCDAVPPAGFNTMRYCNPAYDALDDAQLRELDPAVRRDLQIELTNIVNDDQAISVLLFNKAVIGARPRVHNLVPSGYGTWWSLPWVWLDAP